jgi:hypothetical protein
MTLSRRTALTAIAALPAAVVMPAISVAGASPISVAASSPPDAELRALVDQFVAAQKRCDDWYHRADMLSGYCKQEPVPKALFWQKSDKELGLPGPYEGRPDETSAYDLPRSVEKLRGETWWLTSVEWGEDGNWMTLKQFRKAPSPEARARADEIISAFDGWWKPRKPLRGHKKAMREVDKATDEIHDLGSQIADFECPTPGDLCEKIRGLMAYDGVAAIEDINIDQGISEEIALSIFRDLRAMAGKAAA